MRRGQVGVLLAVTSGLFSVLLAVAVNVATGGSLPGGLASVSWLAWPAVGLLGLIGIGLAIWQQHLANAPAAAVETSVDALPVPAELPAAPALFGRDHVAREVGQMLTGAAVVVIAAAPGTGKTALALRVAHDVRERFPDGQLYAALLGGAGAAVSPEAVLTRFLGALGHPVGDGRMEEAAAFGPAAVEQRVDRGAGVEQRVETAAGVERRVETAAGVEQRVETAAEIEQRVETAAEIEQRVETAAGVEERVDRAAGVVRRVDSGVGGAGRGQVEELAARFRSVVADRAVLVVLDDARDAAQVVPLLPGGGRCATLVTSRVPLVEVPGARVVGLGAIDDDAGLELLADVVGAGRLAGDPEGASALVAASGGLPLAVRIVGGRLRARAGWTPGQLAGRLADERGRLDELRQGELAVRAAFRGAYDGLSAVEQVVFRRAGSHPGPEFGLVAAAARAGLAAGETSAALERLADLFLLESPAPDRYRRHDLLRLFAIEMVEAAGERRDVVRRALLALETDVGAAVLWEGVAAGLLGEVRAAADQVAHRLADPFDRLAAWQAAVEARREEGGAGLARAVRWVSHSWTFVGQVQRAHLGAQEALALAEAAGDAREVAQCARRLGEALRDLERSGEAEAALRRALGFFAAAGPVEEEVEVSSALAVLYNNDGRTGESLPLLRRALERLPDEVRDSRRGWVLGSLAYAYRAAGELEAARELAAQAMALAREIGDRYLLGYCHQDSGWVAVAAGEYDRAEGEFGAMLELFRELRVESGVASAVASLGVVADRRGDREAARRAFGEAEERFRRLGDDRRAALWQGHRLELGDGEP
ncbi:tetratricopeptide repeat protein [Dactylosporangium sp. McL0621]|uniref:tetratricopeptide repeat protein n=1 Tax=Dactylosporangium sp. McL0621 TaxID=3415678 RepID=UPI003CEB76C7